MVHKPPIECAKAYVAASNAHDVDMIGTMLSVDCHYVSSGVGEHRGRKAVLAMMTKFFGQNPHVHWKTRNWRAEEAHVASFDFTITLASGAFDGHECIVMNEDGLIAEIRVER